MTLALLVVSSGVVAGGSMKSWSAPFHGKFTQSLMSTHGPCPASRNNTQHSSPAFNSTTGRVQFYLEANTSGGVCPATGAFGAIHTSFTFTTHSFTEAAGLRHVAITWTLHWYASLVSAGGKNGSRVPASAAYGVGMNGAQLCDTTNSSCTVFPNSSAAGSGFSIGWSASQMVTNSTYHAFPSVTVTLYLNSTFVAHHSYQISTSMFGYVDAYAHHGTYHAQAYLVVLPILGGSARLVSITIH
ncbi:MAG: hypothetical protein L3K19_08345 [Thermoplasmata archaeon]|nr:hypothetical protein [Thermoplasmata archaeon]